MPYTNVTVPAVKAVPWVPPLDLEKVQAEATRWIRVILADLEMPEDARSRRVGHELWAFTEIRSAPPTKYNLRFCTATVLGDDEVEIRHEHVVERKWLRDQLLANPADVELVLALAESCVTSKAEAAALTSDAKGLFGWKRYQHLGLVVFDRLTQQPADLEVLIAQQQQQLEQLGASGD